MCCLWLCVLLIIRIGWLLFDVGVGVARVYVCVLCGLVCPIIFESVKKARVKLKLHN